MGNRIVAQRFQAIAARYDRVSNAYTVRRRAEALRQWVRGRVVEFGGGTGVVAAQLDDPSRVLHTDIAPAMCREARQKLKCPTLCCDAEAVPIRSESFDAVIASEMIYYLANPQRFLDHAFRILRPGGQLLISATNPLATVLDRGRRMLRKLGFRGMFFPDGAPRFLRMREVTHMLIRSGFRVDHTHRIVLLPIGFLDSWNRVLERTPVGRLGLFMIVVARKDEM